MERMSAAARGFGHDDGASPIKAPPVGPWATATNKEPKVVHNYGSLYLKAGTHSGARKAVGVIAKNEQQKVHNAVERRVRMAVVLREHELKERREATDGFALARQSPIRAAATRVVTAAPGPRSQKKSVAAQQAKVAKAVRSAFGTGTLELYGLGLETGSLGKLGNTMFLQMAMVREVHLQGNLLRAVPMQAWQAFRWVTSLSLSMNQLQHVDKYIGLTMALQSLDLAQNRVTTFSDEFLTRTTLTDLNLSKNEIYQLPKDFGKNFAYLKTLNLSNNFLVLLPELFNRMASLTDLDLSYNKLWTLALVPPVTIPGETLEDLGDIREWIAMEDETTGETVYFNKRRHMIRRFLPHLQASAVGDTDDAAAILARLSPKKKKPAPPPQPPPGTAIEDEPEEEEGGEAEPALPEGWVEEVDEGRC